LFFYLTFLFGAKIMKNLKSTHSRLRRPLLSHLFSGLAVSGLVASSIVFNIHVAQAQAPVELDIPIATGSTSMCLEISNNSTEAGATVVQAHCVIAAKQRWKFVKLSDDYYHIVSPNGMCLNVSGNSQYAGAALIQWPCGDADNLNDQWRLPAHPNGYYHEIVSRSSGQCANVRGGASTTFGTPVIQWPCQPAEINMEWFLIGIRP
jgi:Ricin-type beta-trefoil lectin domain